MSEAPKCECGETMIDGSYVGYYCPKGWDCPASIILIQKGEDDE